MPGPRSERTAKAGNGFLQAADLLPQRGDHRVPVVFGQAPLVTKMPAARARALRDYHAIHMASASG
jgi:hypothetical protein